MLSQELSISNEQTLSLRDKEQRKAYRRWRSDVFEQLLLADMDEDALLWESCHAQPKRTTTTTPNFLHKDVAGYYCCPDHRDHCNHTVYHSCDLRYCPECARRHAARLVHQYAPVAERLHDKRRAGFRLRKVVLTTSIDLLHPDARTYYESGFDAVRATMDDVLGNRWIKSSGAIVTAEFGEHGNRLHYHLLVYSKFIGQIALSEAWGKNSPDGSSVVWIEDALKVYPDVKTAVKEALKYAAKFWKKDKNGVFRGLEPKLVPTLAKLLKGTRRVRSWGLFYGCDKPERKLECDICHKEMIRIPLEAWKVYAFDAAGLTPSEFMQWYRAAHLNLKLANKSAQKEGEPPPEQPPPEGKSRHLPGFEPGEAKSDTKHNAISL